MNALTPPPASRPLLASSPAFLWEDDGTCPMRDVLDRIGDSWSLLVIINLQKGPVRFNALKRSIEGISQRMLTVTLRSLERDGLVNRTVRPTMPPEVEYGLTELGHSLAGPIDALCHWAFGNRERMRTARARFDARSPE